MNTSSDPWSPVLFVAIFLLLVPVYVAAVRDAPEPPPSPSAPVCTEVVYEPGCRCAPCDPAPPRPGASLERRVDSLAAAIASYAERAEHYVIGPERAERFAVACVGAVEQHELAPRGVDEYDLCAIAWNESRFRVEALGDQGRSCGAFQIRHDLPGRPTCAELEDVALSADWTAERLASTCLRDDGAVEIACHNGAGAGAREYERTVRRVAALMRGVQ